MQTYIHVCIFREVYFYKLLKLTGVGKRDAHQDIQMADPSLAESTLSVSEFREAS